ncbi:MAG: tripartite tricarboxylate transporter permease, partial [Beijerinckiaceae bacterium]
KFEGIKARIDLRGVLQTLKEMPRYWLALIRGSLIGVWMGITPGGPTAASFMSYGIAKRFSSRRENFGKGEPEGVVAPETADHGAGTAAMLPMLALGIPGSATAAVMLGGLMIWGLNPGPMLFTERPDFVWGLIASMYIGNVVAVILVLATVPIFAAILRIPFAIIGPIIVVVCFIGAWTVGASVPDLWLALIFGVIGYVFKKLDYPIAPLVLALVLGDKAEDAFRQSMLMSQGSLTIFVANPLVTTITMLGMGLLLWPLFGAAIGRMRRTNNSAPIHRDAAQ